MKDFVTPDIGRPTAAYQVSGEYATIGTISTEVDGSLVIRPRPPPPWHSDRFKLIVVRQSTAVSFPSACDRLARSPEQAATVSGFQS
jgi:hypothetical protein